MWGNWLTFSLSSFLLLGKSFTGENFLTEQEVNLIRYEGYKRPARGQIEQVLYCIQNLMLIIFMPLGFSVRTPNQQCSVLPQRINILSCKYISQQGSPVRLRVFFLLYGKSYICIEKTDSNSGGLPTTNMIESQICRVSQLLRLDLRWE